MYPLQEPCALDALRTWRQAGAPQQCRTAIIKITTSSYPFWSDLVDGLTETIVRHRVDAADRFDTRIPSLLTSRVQLGFIENGPAY